MTNSIASQVSEIVYSAASNADGRGVLDEAANRIGEVLLATPVMAGFKLDKSFRSISAATRRGEIYQLNFNRIQGDVHTEMSVGLVRRKDKNSIEIHAFTHTFIVDSVKGLIPVSNVSTGVCDIKLVHNDLDTYLLARVLANGDDTVEAFRRKKSWSLIGAIQSMFSKVFSFA